MKRLPSIDVLAFGMSLAIVCSPARADNGFGVERVLGMEGLSTVEK